MIRSMTKYMRSKNRKHIIILIAGFIILVVIEYMSPKPVDWSLSFNKNDKIPYGNHVLYNLLPDVFKGKRIIDNTESLYEFFHNNDPHNSNIIFITDEFNPDELDLDNILSFVASGSHAFISAIRYKDNFLDTLNLGITADWFNINVSVSDSTFLNFVNPGLKKDTGYFFDKILYRYYFTSFDTANTCILGVNEKQKPNYIKTSFGKGCFYINTQPLVFTNYNLIHNSADYIFKALSYLPVNQTIWDEYYKPTNKKSLTPLRVLLNNPPFRAAYYLLITGLILFMIFEGKRRQRVIPVIKPLKNTSLIFVRTIGRLYLHNKNHKDIVLKKYRYFLEFVRTRYYLKTNEINEDMYEKLAEKSGININTIKKLFDKVRYIDQKVNISNIELLEFNKVLENFYKYCH